MKRTPSRGFWLGMGAVLSFALALASVAALVATRETQPGPASNIPTAPLEARTGPYQIMPDPFFSLGQIEEDEIETDSVQANPPPVDSSPAASTPTDPPAPSSSTVQAPATIASSVSAPPTPVPPAPAPPPEPPAVRLVREASERFGVRIVLEGQDWGPDEASQLMNIQAVISVMERLPARVRSAVGAHPHGPLTFLSNRQGRTLDGWQPYGNFPIGFYTNSDQPALSAVEGGPSGSRAANEVVLITGFSDMSIGHEVLHAYHFRNVGPDQYVLALLGDEMRSFMAASGWRQVGTDQEVRAAADDPWDVLNALYVYEGRPLTYTTVAGNTVTLTPPNPLEAFAVAGSIYYTRPTGMALPHWPDYWTWFRDNLG